MASGRNWTVLESIVSIIAYLEILLNQSKLGQRSKTFQARLEEKFHELWTAQNKSEVNDTTNTRKRTGCAILSHVQRTRAFILQLDDIWKILDVVPSFKYLNDTDKTTIISKLFTRGDEVALQFLKKAKNAQLKGPLSAELQQIVSIDVDYRTHEYCKNQYEVWREVGASGRIKSLTKSQSEATPRPITLKLPCTIRKKSKPKQQRNKKEKSKNNKNPLPSIHSQQSPCNVPNPAWGSVSLDIMKESSFLQQVSPADIIRDVLKFGSNNVGHSQSVPMPQDENHLVRPFIPASPPPSLAPHCPISYPSSPLPLSAPPSPPPFLPIASELMDSTAQAIDSYEWLNDYMPTSTVDK